MSPTIGPGRSAGLSTSTLSSQRVSIKNSLLLFTIIVGTDHSQSTGGRQSWAATSQEKGSDIAYAGREAFFNAWRSFFDDNPQRLDSHSFATQLLKHLQPQYRNMYSSHSVAIELRQVARWFTVGGTYYD